MKLQKGFTLIELMLTVAIVGILSAVALPAYQSYTIRAQTSEGLSLAGGAILPVADYYQNNGAFPTTSVMAKYNSAVGKYVSSISITTAGVVTATFGGQANAAIAGGTLTFTPTLDVPTGYLVWTCSGSASVMSYVPSSCN